jgi:hypothetical protein
MRSFSARPAPFCRGWPAIAERPAPRPRLPPLSAHPRSSSRRGGRRRRLSLSSLYFHRPALVAGEEEAKGATGSPGSRLSRQYFVFQSSSSGARKLAARASRKVVPPRESRSYIAMQVGRMLRGLSAASDLRSRISDLESRVFLACASRETL